MLRRDVDEGHEAAAEVTAATKIRKRCALSSSSSSGPRSTTRRQRLRRSVRLIGRSGAPCETSKSRRRMSESSWTRQHHHTRPTSAASARKLVGALWQLDGGVGSCEGEGEVRRDAFAAARRGSDHRRSVSMEVSRLSRRKSRALEGDGERSWHDGRAQGHWFSDAVSNGGTMEGLASPCPGDGTPQQLQELYTSMTVSKELVRVLANVLAPGVLNPTAAALLAALRSELDVARARARQLAREHRRRGGDEATERMWEEMRAWKIRHREKAAAAARLVASELDAERRARHRAERVGRKLGEALAEAEASLREARRELERERKARERVEKVRDELASGVGGLSGMAADVDESAREELEREREMMQLADELREERVRMKLAEAGVQFEEKNAVVDRLRQELEAFLGRDDKHAQEESPAHDVAAAAADHRLQLVLASESVNGSTDRVATRKNGEVDDDSSDGSDIELNVDGDSRDYSWSYSTASKDTATGKNAASRSSRHGSFSDRGTDRSGGCVFDGRLSQTPREAPEQHWGNEGCSDDVDDGDGDRTDDKDVDEDAERYEAIRNLREQMLAGHGFDFLSRQSGAGAAADAEDRDRHRHAGFVR